MTHAWTCATWLRRASMSTTPFFDSEERLVNAIMLAGAGEGAAATKSGKSVSRAVKESLMMQRIDCGGRRNTRIEYSRTTTRTRTQRTP